MLAEFIQSLGKRIESFLPNVTGYTIAEVELNPQFLVTRNVLSSGDTNYFASHVLATFCKLLDSINEEAEYAEISDRHINSISSTLIILKLLFDFVNRHWVLKQDIQAQLLLRLSAVLLLSSTSEGKNASARPSQTLSAFDYSRPFNFAMFYHYEPPRPLQHEVIHPSMESITSLFLTQMAKRTYATVKRISHTPLAVRKPDSATPEPNADGNVHLSPDRVARDDNGELPPIRAQSQHARVKELGGHTPNSLGLQLHTQGSSSASTLTPITSITSTAASIANHNQSVVPTPSHTALAGMTAATPSSLFENSATSNPSQLAANFVDETDAERDDLYEKLTSDIDKYCQVLLKFIAVSNPLAYYGFIDHKLFSYAKKGQMVPSFQLIKYSALIEFVFYDEQVGQGMATIMSNFLPYVRSSTWKQVVLVFYANSIKSQCFSRPEDYLAIVQANSALELNCKSLFDFVFTVFDNHLLLGVSSMVLAWLVILCLSDFIELSNRPNKLKINFNKRLKFLSKILKETRSLQNLESFDSLINIFYLAARLPKSQNNHPVYQFCVEHLDATFEELHKLKVTFKSQDASNLFDTLVINLNVVAVLINPDKYIPTLTSKYYQSQGNLKEMKILVKVVKGLSELKKSQVEFDQVMTTLKESLKGMIVGSTKLLDHHAKKTKETTQAVVVEATDSSARETQSVALTESTPSSYVNKNLHSSTTSERASEEIPRSTNAHKVSDFARDKTTGGSASINSLSVVIGTEEILSDLFYIFISVPETYFIDAELLQGISSLKSLTKNHVLVEDFRLIQKFSYDVISPLSLAFRNSKNGDTLLDASCSLAMSLVARNLEDKTINYRKVLLSSYISLNYIIHYVAETCLTLTLTDPKYKTCLIFLNDFLEFRDALVQDYRLKDILQSLDPACKVELASLSCTSLEKTFLLSLCTHDIQCFDIAKSLIRWYTKEINTLNNVVDEEAKFFEPECYNVDLFSKVGTIINDNSVFTGFVSLHKKICNFLRSLECSAQLGVVWMIILERWTGVLELNRTHAKLDAENLVLRHYTGFLVSTCGLLMKKSNESQGFHESDPRHLIMDQLNGFFDRCILLLTSEDLVVRVIVKDVISSEPQPRVSRFVFSKLVNTLKSDLEAKDEDDSDEHVFFIEQLITVMTLMFGARNEGRFVLVALIPEVAKLVIKFVNKLDQKVSSLRLKIRFSKLGVVIETDKVLPGIRGAIKLRNVIARSLLDWLQQAVFHETDTDKSSVSTPTSRLSPESLYLNIDLATECSKFLALILEGLPLEIPEGTRDKEVKKAKEIAFANYFSVFYKIIQKYNADGATVKSKYKVHLVTENVIKCISNILQTETDVGIHFVLPISFHENNKIRSIFINVFANMFSTRKYQATRPDDSFALFEELTNYDDICGVAARIASSSERNLLASSLFSVFGYTRKLDKLFHTLLMDEIACVSRTTDIFRRNSTLTRLMANFAKDYGATYLQKTLRPFVEELSELDVFFEVEKERDHQSPPPEVSNSEQPSLDSYQTQDSTIVTQTLPDAEADKFMAYFRKLVHAITSSVDIAPDSIKFICKEIYSCLRAKGETEDALIAVGSYLFLRFFCPAIISPEVYLNSSISSPKVKRSLMQLVKVIQNIVNGSVLVKWTRLQNKTAELEEINKEIFKFLRQMSSSELSDSDSSDSTEKYAFQDIWEAPLPEMRYLHKFFYSYYVEIVTSYTLDESFDSETLLFRIARLNHFDRLILSLGLPKTSLALQLNPTIKLPENEPAMNPHFADFMAKLALTYAEVSPDLPLVHTTIFEDGTPLIVVNLGLLKAQLNNDIELLVYRIFDMCMQVWDNKFYIVYDLTECEILNEFCDKHLSLMHYYAPESFVKNCARLYYFNIPIFNKNLVIKSMLFFKRDVRSKGDVHIYTYSQCDGSDMVGKLGLSNHTMAVIRDTRVSFHNVQLYDFEAGTFIRVTLKIGRKWFQICSEEPHYYEPGLCVTDLLHAVLVKRLTDVTKCEVVEQELVGDQQMVPGIANNPTEALPSMRFTIQFNDNQHLILSSSKRLEIVRFLYFATSKLPLAAYTESSDVLREGSEEPRAGPVTPRNKGEEEVIPLLWFLRLYNSVFQALLCNDDEVRSSAAFLFAALSYYFDMDMGISLEHSKNISFPENTTDFIVSTSKYLATEKPELTYRFFKAFFDYYEKLPDQQRVSAIMYVSPWIVNVCDCIYMSPRGNDGDIGTSRTIDIIRLFCKITGTNRNLIPFINDYIWKKLFAEARLTSVLIDEVVAFAIDSISEGPGWSHIIKVITPSVEVCDILVSRLKAAILDTKQNVSVVATQSKLIEISVLIKICLVVFFDLYYFAQMFISDIFFFCTLFVGHPTLDVGSDLQKLVSKTVQSFLHKPDLTTAESQAIEATLTYLLGQRAHLLFGIKVDSYLSPADIAQIYNRATSFEILCDHLLKFLSDLGTSTDSLANWRSGWCTDAIDVAFCRTSVFQSRAILLVGVLSKYGIGDSLALRILKVTSRQRINSLAYLVSQIISTSRLIEGLSTSSVLPPFLFWPQLCMSLMDNIALYQPSIICFINIMKKATEHSITKDGNLIDKVFESRRFLRAFVDQFEKRYDMKFAPHNIEIYIFCAFSRGLVVSHIKHTSLKCLMDYVKFKVQHHTPLTSTTLLPHVTFIYLSTNEAQYRAFMREIDLSQKLGFDEKIKNLAEDAPKEEIHYDHIHRDASDCCISFNHAPKYVVDFFLTADDTSKFTLVQAANFLGYETVDAIFKANFLNLFKDLLHLKRDVAYLVYHLIKPHLEKTLINSNSVEMVETILDILLYPIQDRSYSAEKYDMVIQDKLREHELTAIFQSELDRSKDFDEDRLLDEVTCLQEMTYRSACSYIESNRLED